MTKHTPAPWVVDGYNLASVIHCTAERGSPEAKHTCGDYEVIARCEGDNWKANAKLIAVAPEAVDLLKNILSTRWLSIDFEHNRTPEAMLWRSRIVEVLAKARIGA